MKFRHPQHIAAAWAGFSERTAPSSALPPAFAIRSRRVADPLTDWRDREMRPMLEAHPGLRPVALLEEMQLRHRSTGIGCVVAWSVGFMPGASNTAPIAR